ncbi:MAG: amidohydrolase [Bradymonadia bacterium]
MRRISLAVLMLVAVTHTGCGSQVQTQSTTISDNKKSPRAPQVSSALRSAQPVLIYNALILTADDSKPKIPKGWLLLKNGLISNMGAGDPPAQIKTEAKNAIDASGQYVTPGFVDTHSHLGVYAAPNVWAHSDGNEMTNPITSGVRAEDAFWPQDPGIQRAVAGGVTTIQVLPGSGNVIGGQGFTLKLHPRREAAAMKFNAARNSLKMACGENPKRVYGKSKKRMPMSRMGSLYLMRKTWFDAKRYRDQWQRWREKGQRQNKPAPAVNLNLQTLADVLDNKILVHIHCYRADDMLQQIKLSHEFGYKIRSFHHAVEAYKIRDILAAEEISVSTWADWWGFKIEAHDSIEQNLALLSQAGVKAILHTDSPEGIQRMNQEAAKALYAGRRQGLEISEHDALKWITLNPAWALGIDDKLGSITIGKAADVVIWDRSPLSVYAKATQVFIDGREVLERYRHTKWSDFEVKP